MMSSALCACGCGQFTSGKRNANTGLLSRFVNGHNGRGKPLSTETKRKLSEAQTGKTISPSSRAAVTGERNGHWKGDDASYSAIHIWRLTHRPKSGICAECGAERKTEWHNISGTYPRDDESDWQELCRGCHQRTKRWTRPCVGCGCDVDDRTPGCTTCKHRHWWRTNKRDRG
jgi:hypothetical protein